MEATHAAGGTGGHVGACHTCMSPSTTRVLVPKSVGVWILPSSSVGVGGGGGLLGSGAAGAGGIGVGGGGVAAHATTDSSRRTVDSKTAIQKLVCDSMNSPPVNSSLQRLSPKAIIDSRSLGQKLCRLAVDIKYHRSLRNRIPRRLKTRVSAMPRVGQPNISCALLRPHFAGHEDVPNPGNGYLRREPGPESDRLAPEWVAVLGDDPAIRRLSTWLSG